MPGKHIIVFGSGSIVSQLTEYGLIDEYQFAVCPVFLGRGKPLLGGASKSVRLELVDSTRLDSGDVLVAFSQMDARSRSRPARVWPRAEPDHRYPLQIEWRCD